MHCDYQATIAITRNKTLNDKNTHSYETRDNKTVAKRWNYFLWLCKVKKDLLILWLNLWLGKWYMNHQGDGLLPMVKINNDVNQPMWSKISCGRFIWIITSHYLILRYCKTYVPSHGICSATCNVWELIKLSWSPYPSWEVYKFALYMWYIFHGFTY